MTCLISPGISKQRAVSRFIAPITLLVDLDTHLPIHGSSRRPGTHPGSLYCGQLAQLCQGFPGCPPLKLNPEMVDHRMQKVLTLFGANLLYHWRYYIVDSS